MKEYNPDLTDTVLRLKEKYRKSIKKSIKEKFLDWKIEEKKVFIEEDMDMKMEEIKDLI